MTTAFIDVNHAEMVFETRKGRFHALREIDLKPGYYQGMIHVDENPLAAVHVQVYEAEDDD